MPPHLDEVGRHLYPQQISEIYSYLHALEVSIDERWSVPFEFAVRYVEKGLKKGDAFIAGYAEWVRADILISENRADIVSQPRLFPFKVFTAEDCLKKYF